LRDLVERAIVQTRIDSEEDERAYDFISPPFWPLGVEALSSRHRVLAELERQIDDEVYRLYDISPHDRRAIEEELAAPSDNIETDGEEALSESGDEVPEADDSGSLTEVDLAQRWVSYAAGIALGRFEPGASDGFGRGTFSREVNEKLRTLIHTGGLMVLQLGHPEDLTARVVAILTAIHGDVETDRIVRTAIDSNGDLHKKLVEHLLGPFFKTHVKRYRKRPIYWLLQSPKQNYSVYLFHERATNQTLALLQGTRYLGGRIFQVRQQLDETKQREAAAEGKEKARSSKLARELAEELQDLEAFDQEITATNNEHIEERKGEAVAHWHPEFDDGVLLNAAPLYRLTPGWKKADSKLDLAKAWKALSKGEYPWSKTGMRYWPRETLAACRDNKSYRIAHGLE